MLEVCVVGEAGIEPATPSLEGSCSIRLSYSPTRGEVCPVLAAGVTSSSILNEAETATSK